MEILQHLYRQHFGADPASVDRLPASGSHRTYYRLASPAGTAIGALGTDPDENRAFLTESRHFRSKGLPVPEIYAVSEDGMAYLQEDLGTVSLYDAVAKGRASGDYDEGECALLEKTIRLLPRLQFDGAEGFDWSVCYPQREFDARMVDFDLNYFKYDFLKLTGVEFNEIRLQDDFDRLKADLLSVRSDTFLYRDFQARNVMLRDGEPCFIDYQGGRKGPFYYDLASFVWQARARYPDGLKLRLIKAYREELARYVAVPHDEFERNLRLFTLFRTLQVLGAYGFRGLHEKKAYFIESLPFALRNLQRMLPLPEYPYLSEVLQAVSETPRTSRGMTDDSCLTITVQSFSYKKGLPEDPTGNGGGYVFDCRGTHNPGRYEQYKQMTGRDEAVIRFLEEDGEILPFLEHAYALVDHHAARFQERGFTSLQVSFGCTGGQHRSVYCADRMAAHLHEKFPKARIVLIHRERGIHETIEPQPMKTLSIPRIPRVERPDAIYEALKAIEPQPIACDTWHPTDNVPEVNVRVAHDGEAILLRYDVCEREVRAACVQDGDPSWKDSCVEFFIAPEGDDFYYNFEFSCAGTLYLQGGRPGDRVSPSPEVFASVVRGSSLMGPNREMSVPDADGFYRWSLVARIPVTALWRHDFKSTDALKTARGNFYKCGDLLPNPHFLSWAPIDLPEPAFHCPPFFGRLEF